VESEVAVIVDTIAKNEWQTAEQNELRGYIRACMDLVEIGKELKAWKESNK
jgi:hypothetical protein